ncbi:MAG: steryl acetyl hydrolase [Rubrivivax sp.]|nr:MAG: steryl acetyl hydrolase [Rubrivivax sp.]
MFADQRSHTERADSLSAIIIGTGFAGLGMAIALRKAGIDNFVILEKAYDVGGVWRDNSYPGAACDVPSHLYSFSFEPNPRWSRVFAAQGEIFAYLQHCARKYDLTKHIRFGSEVTRCWFDEGASVWRVSVAGGRTYTTSVLISGTGQLSRPSLPKLPGIDAFKGRSFHSANWDHTLDLTGKRVAVVGTGASAVQFVPAIAGKVCQLHVFQRSPTYIKARPDRPYSGFEKAMFRHLPGAMRLHRAWIYLKYEAQALAFTRFKGLMKWAVGRPFQRLLQTQVTSPELRKQLTPDYAIGCKRILLSSEYLATINRSYVQLQTQGIRRVVANGIETEDGQVHEADVIIYGTGFAATEFLSPMRITGLNGVDLNAAWQDGASAYLGMTVPGFPNFFMLYGPNTNLGHNSIVYMIESQIAHVMRCLRAMQQVKARVIEVDEQRFKDYNHHIQSSLQRTVWNGCRSWYVDAKGHNSTNWPGFTLTYRWLTRFSGLHAYRFSRDLGGDGNKTVLPSPGVTEAAGATVLRAVLRTAFRSLIGPPFSPRFQRNVVAFLSPWMTAVGGVRRERISVSDLSMEVVTASSVRQSAGAILYLHGGAFCLGNAQTHRSITTRLALASGLTVHVPEYRLAPEHAYPAALHDALASYAWLRQQGHAPDRIVLAGDSAGGALALALAIVLRDKGEPAAAGLVLISPVTDPALEGASLASKRGTDPMIRQGWLRQGLDWYQAPTTCTYHHPLETNLAGLPPMLIQVGGDEILKSDAMRLAAQAASYGVPCQLELHESRWHVFHLQASYLRSASQALRTLAGYARRQVAQGA